VNTAATELDKEQWLDILIGKRRLSGPLHLSRFVERIYFLTKPISWAPNPAQPYQRVDAPPGFVTDFASVPRPFWSFLPPDDAYAYAAVLHDYLYWTQIRPREEADQILKFAMQDLRVGAVTIEAIYTAVRVAGGGAWESNKAARQRGENRILKPTSSQATRQPGGQTIEHGPTSFLTMSGVRTPVDKRL
jgi:hypothetical protein